MADRGQRIAHLVRDIRGKPPECRELHLARLGLHAVMSSRKITAPTLRLRPTGTKRALIWLFCTTVSSGLKATTGFLRHWSSRDASAGA